MDNWYMSIPSANELLKNHKLTCVGTLRKDKRETPQEFPPNKNRPLYSSLFGFRAKELTLTSYVPKKNKSVLVLSSMHEDNQIDLLSKEQLKPEITFYNSTKGGVDTVDELCGNKLLSFKKMQPLAS
ncbi:uncharacterized protein LOC118202186 [Stegodyphus dumicola]|uniref:uncharacterized protein LOC118202186 n=1 Tax=Stegodyphus dumicola TaxID=202533 RepID=UPI0015AA608A|nr:uncharacterized protein LOC118202186 [Stegodyphus dumicola]